MKHTPSLACPWCDYHFTQALHYNEHYFCPACYRQVILCWPFGQWDCRRWERPYKRVAHGIGQPLTADEVKHYETL